MTMEMLTISFVAGLSLAGIYILGAIGLTLMFGVHVHTELSI